MASIVEEMQALAANSSVPISDILRRAKISASKLGLTNEVVWANSELNGYTSEVPIYRKIPQRLVYFNIANGWQSLVIQKFEFLNEPRSVTLPIREIEEHSKNPNGFIFMALPASVQADLAQMIGLQTEIRNQISTASLTAVLDSVRTRLLDWSLELERLGIQGEGVGFSAVEKAIAKENSTIIHFNGPVGNIAGPIGNILGNTTIHAHQSQIENRAKEACKIAELLREGASTASEADAEQMNDIAADIDAATSPFEEPRLQRALRSARHAIPKLVSWGARAVATEEISRLLSPS